MLGSCKFSKVIGRTRRGAGTNTSIRRMALFDIAFARMYRNTHVSLNTTFFEIPKPATWQEKRTLVFESNKRSAEDFRNKPYSLILIVLVA
jgi:hypothetical protein